MSTGLAKFEQFSLAPKNLDEAMRFAELVAKSDLAGPNYKGRPGNIIVALQYGAEIGLSPMQALQSIAVINGRPCLYGDALLALVQSQPDFEDIIEEVTGEVPSAVASCTIKRKGRTATVRTFSMADARAAGLLGKAGPWKEYTRRMLQMRARAFCIRDAYADRLRGIQSAEEQRDVVEAKAKLVPSDRPAANPNVKRIDTKKYSSVPPPLTTPTDPGDFVIKAGKNANKKLRELNRDQLAWYASDCKDTPTLDAAQAYLESLIEQEARATAAAAAADPPDRPDPPDMPDPGDSTLNPEPTTHDWVTGEVVDE